MYLQKSYNIGVKNDLITFSQAMSSKETYLWYNVMKDEMWFMASNQVLDLVELPNNVKLIGCRWVFKTKKDSQDNIERNKTKLDVKGFT